MTVAEPNDYRTFGSGVRAVLHRSFLHSSEKCLMAEDDPQKVLERSIEHAANRVLEGKLPAAWAGEQLVALIRHWGYLGYDWEMPEAFSQFDLVMMDLECFPDGRMTNDMHIVAAARDVLATVRPS